MFEIHFIVFLDLINIYTDTQTIKIEAFIANLQAHPVFRAAILNFEFLAGKPRATIWFPLFLNSAYSKIPRCKFSCFYPEVHDMAEKCHISAPLHCIAEVKAWMKVNKLKLNDEKTEVILLGNNNITKYVPSPSLHINDISLEATDKVKNLGVTIDKNLSLSFFISSLCKNSYVQLRKIASIRHCLTTEVTKTLVTSLVLSRLDYCNAVLAGTSKKFLSRLQVVQNNAARLI